MLSEMQWFASVAAGNVGEFLLTIARLCYNIDVLNWTIIDNLIKKVSLAHICIAISG